MYQKENTINQMVKKKGRTILEVLNTEKTKDVIWVADRVLSVGYI